MKNPFRRAIVAGLLISILILLAPPANANPSSGTPENTNLLALTRQGTRGPFEEVMIEEEDGSKTTYYTYNTENFTIWFPTEYINTDIFRIRTTIGVDSMPTVVVNVAKWLEDSWKELVIERGFLPPKISTTRYLDVFLMELDNEYLGLTQVEKTSGNPYIIIDPFIRDEKTMQATVAHEFFHTIQLGYDFKSTLEFTTKMAEGTATWAEEVVFDNTSNYLQMINNAFLKTPENSLFGYTEQNPITNYGTFLWYEFLTEKYGRNIVRDLWQEYFNRSRTRAQDSAIPQVYRGYQANTAVLHDKYQTTLKDAFSEFALWNIDTALYREGDKIGEAARVLKVKSYPFESSQTIIREIPHALGTNYISLDTMGAKQDLTVQFGGNRDAEFYVALVPVRSGVANLKKKVDTVVPFSGITTLSIDPENYSEVIMVIAVINNQIDVTKSEADIFTNLTYPYSFRANLGKLTPPTTSTATSPTTQAPIQPQASKSPTKIPNFELYISRNQLQKNTNTFEITVNNADKSQQNTLIEKRYIQGTCSYTPDCEILIQESEPTGEKSKIYFGKKGDNYYVFRVDDHVFAKPILAYSTYTSARETYTNKQDIGKAFSLLDETSVNAAQSLTVSLNYETVDFDFQGKTNKALKETETMLVNFGRGTAEQVCVHYLLPRKGNVAGSCQFLVNKTPLLYVDEKLTDMVARTVNLRIAQGGQAQQLPTANKTFTDISATNPAYEAIMYLAEKSNLGGYTDGTYQPDRKVNRAEFTKILMETIYPGTATGKDCFPDVKDWWYAPYVCTAKQKGLIGGWPDGSFHPNVDMDIASAYKILLEAYVGAGNIPPAPGEWFRKYLAYAEANNLKFKANLIPWESLTRGGMAQILYMLEREVGW